MRDHLCRQESNFPNTERLFIRPWEEGDRDAFHQIMADPEVHKFTNEDPWTEETTGDVMKWFLDNKGGWDWKPGHFNCPLILRETNELIGRVGLNPFMEEENIPEIEWTLGQAYWGRGYATEIGKAILQYGFEYGGFDAIIGFAFPENKASRRVMEKIEMAFIGDKVYRNRTFSFYRINKQDTDEHG